MIKLASWNVNSLNVRLEQVLEWIQAQDIDILALQETKLVDEKFPLHRFTEKGYHAVFAGQKTYNGVAIISRFPVTDVQTVIPELQDEAKRILAVTVAGMRLINLYVPNGFMVNSDKYYYKLDWLKKVLLFVEQQLVLYPELVVLGDFNIAPEDKDVHAPEEWEGCVHVSPAEREAFALLLKLGLYDSFRLFSAADQTFSWWDYRAAGFRRNRGLRIDHILVNDSLKQACVSAHIDKAPRTLMRPSDHAPVCITLNK